MLDRNVVKFIVLAQVGSDAGKGIYELNACPLATESEQKAAERGKYAIKDRWIYQALERVAGKRNTEFHFYVTDGEITPYLVYFDFKVEGKRFQISFHSFDSRLQKFYESSRKSRTRWDEKSSRESCERLVEYFSR